MFFIDIIWGMPLSFLVIFKGFLSDKRIE